MKFHHIGYLTNNFKKTLNEFKKFNYKKKSNVINDQILKVKVQFIQNKNSLIEIVKPHRNNYGLINILKSKNYAYHFAYRVKNINYILNVLKKKKLKIIVNPVPAKAFNNKKIAFLKMNDGFIIELIQS